MIRYYRLKHSSVEAVFYNGKNFDEVEKFTQGRAYKPFYVEHGVRCFTLNTQFGECRVYPGRFIVHIGGRLYIAVEPHVFHEKYEEIPKEAGDNI